MIDIAEKRECCGCYSCVRCCPRSCITMREDEEGFLYPLVNTAECVDCGLCERVCPVLHQAEVREPLAVYAAKNRDEEIRRQSSSGGVFTVLAEKMIEEGESFSALVSMIGGRWFMIIQKMLKDWSLFGEANMCRAG